MVFTTIDLPKLIQVAIIRESWNQSVKEEDNSRYQLTKLSWFYHRLLGGLITKLSLSTTRQLHGILDQLHHHSLQEPATQENGIESKSMSLISNSIITKVKLNGKQLYLNNDDGDGEDEETITKVKRLFGNVTKIKGRILDIHYLNEIVGCEFKSISVQLYNENWGFADLVQSLTYSNEDMTKIVLHFHPQRIQHHHIQLISYIIENPSVKNLVSLSIVEEECHGDFWLSEYILNSHTCAQFFKKIILWLSSLQSLKLKFRDIESMVDNDEPPVHYYSALEQYLKNPNVNKSLVKYCCNIPVIVCSDEGDSLLKYMLQSDQDGCKLSIIKIQVDDPSKVPNPTRHLKSLSINF